MTIMPGQNREKSSLFFSAYTDPSAAVKLWQPCPTPTCPNRRWQPSSGAAPWKTFPKVASKISKICRKFRLECVILFCCCQDLELIKVGRLCC
jgi:hypothetical protein